jgi:hypothetical protein
MKLPSISVIAVTLLSWSNMTFSSVLVPVIGGTVGGLVSLGVIDHSNDRANNAKRHRLLSNQQNQRNLREEVLQLQRLKAILEQFRRDDPDLYYKVLANPQRAFALLQAEATSAKPPIPYPQ